MLTPRSLFRPPAGLIPGELHTSAKVHHPEAVVMLTSYRNTGPRPFQDWEAVPHDKMKPASPLSPFPLHLESLGESLVMILTMTYSSASLWATEATTFRAWDLCPESDLRDSVTHRSVCPVVLWGPCAPVKDTQPSTRAVFSFIPWLEASRTPVKGCQSESLQECLAMNLGCPQHALTCVCPESAQLCLQGIMGQEGVEIGLFLSLSEMCSPHKHCLFEMVGFLLLYLLILGVLLLLLLF